MILNCAFSKYILSILNWSKYCTTVYFLIPYCGLGSFHIAFKVKFSKITKQFFFRSKNKQDGTISYEGWEHVRPAGRGLRGRLRCRDQPSLQQVRQARPRLRPRLGDDFVPALRHTNQKTPRPAHPVVYGFGTVCLTVTSFLDDR